MMDFYKSVFILISFVLLTRIVLSTLPGIQQTNEKDMILVDHMLIYSASVLMAGFIKFISELLQR